MPSTFLSDVINSESSLEMKDNIKTENRAAIQGHRTRSAMALAASLQCLRIATCELCMSMRGVTDEPFWSISFATSIDSRVVDVQSEQRSTHTDATNLHFQTDSDTSEVDAVFFDPDDVWEKEAADTQVSFTQRKQTVMDESRSSADCSGVVPDVINIRTKKHLSPADAEAQR